MADWFKFHNDELDSKGMQFAISEQPLVTSVLLVILSEASKTRSRKIAWHDEDFELIGYARKINVSVPVFNQCISLLERVGIIKRGNGNIEINGWNEKQSDYAKGLDKGYYNKKKTSKLLASNSEVSTVRREEKRVEEKITILPLIQGEHKAFIDGWVQNFKAAFGVEYQFDGGRDAAAVKKLLSMSILRIDLLEIAKKAWAKQAFFACRQASTIHGFRHNFNAIQVELKNGTNQINPKPNPRNDGIAKQASTQGRETVEFLARRQREDKANEPV